ncbi:unnamed protein product [Rangifer tarandus platyrhynchus]|uniref:Uncharacterized protein n=1 Tax=Rangifer tarandus platyrhynchus TaxID=3082113 RepID=A0ABN8XSF7_RANTA|nr:unnamed protein product [Rangifer tarandus platyrhynchus]
MKGRDVIVMRGEGQHLSDARASACLWETGHSGDSCNDGNLKTLHCVCLLSAYYVSDTESMKFNGEVIELIQKCNECTVINYGHIHQSQLLLLARSSAEPAHALLRKKP